MFRSSLSSLFIVVVLLLAVAYVHSSFDGQDDVNFPGKQHIRGRGLQSSELTARQLSTLRRKVVKAAAAVVVVRGVATGVKSYKANGTFANGPIASEVRKVTKAATATIPGPWNCKKPCRWNGKKKQCLAKDGTMC